MKKKTFKNENQLAINILEAKKYRALSELFEIHSENFDNKDSYIIDRAERLNSIATKLQISINQLA
jgi:hypothetical protein